MANEERANKRKENQTGRKGDREKKTNNKEDKKKEYTIERVYLGQCSIEECMAKLISAHIEK